jgi:GntR family transcriptional regulator, transcriptional repressor for pyruvate dehydrogenase complex
VEGADSGRQRRYLARVMVEHEAIRRAIEAADAAGSRRAMRDHLRRSYRRYQRLARESGD